MDLPVFIFLLLLLLAKLPIIAGNKCSDGDCLLGSLDVTEFLRLQQERFRDYAKLLLEWQPGPDFYGMPWHFVVIGLAVAIIYVTVILRMVCAANSAISRCKKSLERLRAMQSKRRQLEEKLRILEQDRVVLQSDIFHLKQEPNAMQQNLDSKDLCQDSNSTAKQKSDLEYEDTDLEVKVMSLRLQIQEVEQKCRKTEGLLRTEIAFHEKQAQENLINTRKAQYTLAAERKESANLRQKMIEVNAQLEEIKRPVFVPPLRKDDCASGKSEDKLNKEKLQAEKRCEQLEERIKKMECEQASVCKEKNHQESLNMILQEKLKTMQSLCQQKDNSLQQKLAQEEVEQRVKEINADGPKNDIRNLKKKIQEINERNDKTQSALKSQIAVQKKKAESNRVVACSTLQTLGLERGEFARLSSKLGEVSAKLAAYQRLFFKGSVNITGRQIELLDRAGVLSSAFDNVEESENTAAAVEGHNLYLRKLQAEEKKTKKLEQNVHDLKEDRRALKKETSRLQIEIKSCKGKLLNMIELCQRKDQALQRKAAQIDSERRDKDLKVEEARRSHQQKVKAVEKQHQKAELSLKAEIDHLKKQSLENLARQTQACSSGRARATHEKDILHFRKRLDQTPLSTPASSCSPQGDCPC